jgi:hypothetical protein
MTDHHDFGDHHDDYHGGEDHHEEPLSFDDQSHLDDPGHFEDAGHLDDPGHFAADHHEDVAAPEHHETTPAAEDIHVGDDHPDDAATTVTDDYHDPADVFPPAVDVGELPEPVDGFPWIDPAALGAPDPTGHDFPPVDPHELAEYAGTEIPEGADPWTVLAGSDDPATSTLARFWNEAGE